MRTHTTYTMLATVLPLAATALLAAACADGPLTPPDGPEPPVREGAAALGLVEVTISGIGTGSPSASAGPYTAGGVQPRFSVGGVGNADGTGDGTIQLEPVSTGSFTDGERGDDGVRYLRATFRVRNAQEDGTAYDEPRRNLTFLAVDTDASLGETAITALTRFDGGAADPALALDVKPTGAVARTADGTVASEFPDVLQALTETEAADVLADAPADVHTVFPYGAVVRSPDVTPNSRTLPADPAADQFDGVLTFAFELPLQATAEEDPFEVSIVFLAVDDSETRLTESLEEWTTEGAAALQARADALGSTAVVTLLGNSPTVVSDHAVRRICTVRTAGTDPTAPDATLVDAGSCTDGDALPTNVRVVDLDATGSADGTTWTNAFPTLQDALACVRDDAGAGGVCEDVEEIWVAEGVYYPDEGAGATADDPAATFSLIDGIGVYGGFAGSEYRRDQRDPEANVTILSGDITQDDTNADGNAIAEDVADIQGTNTESIVTADGTTTPISRATVLDGFVITAAFSSGLYCDASGGGECSPTLRDLVFSGNLDTSGGGMEVQSHDGGTALPLVVDVTFTGNEAFNDGGAVYNRSTEGGTASPVFVRVTFTGNESGRRAGAFYSSAVSAGSAGIAAPEFYNVVFRENVSFADGGAVYTRDSSPVIVNSVFWNNEADADGGALFVAAGSPALVNATFAGNSAGGSGGTIYSNSTRSAVHLRNVVLWGGTPDGIDGSYATGSTAEESILQGGCPAAFTCTAVLDQDPVFVDAAGGNLRLQNSSPGIDSGSAAHLPDDLADLDGDGVEMEPIPVDLEDNPRVLDVHGGGAIVDMGAYERP